MADEHYAFIDDVDAAPDCPEPAVEEIPAWMDGSVRIGIHTSIAGDFTAALDAAHKLGANALQIFSASPRMWAGLSGGNRMASAAAERFRARRLELGLGPLVIHCNYLINLASPDRMLRTKSTQAFHEEIVRAVELGGDYLVLHPGSGRGAAAWDAITAISEGLRQAARNVKMHGLRILLENTAGQGSTVGARFEELKAILDACPELPLGICMDTAHVFAAGYDVRTVEGLERALRDIANTVGLERLFLVHANDSKAPLASHLDRHQHIGKGHIGLAGFRQIVNHPLLAGRPFILETPIDAPGDDRRNVRTLWTLAGLQAKQAPPAANGFTMFRGERGGRANRRARTARKSRSASRIKPRKQKKAGRK
ncbi:MAG: deoxyribonuclease IV [Candidatus Acidiferrales bacterium]